MPKPYRRRKGKNGPYVGNYRCTVDGRDINLQTKDAHEAHARARLAAKRKWPPVPAAVEAALEALDPGRDKTPDPPPAAGPTEDETGGAPHAGAPPQATHAPPVAEIPSHEELEDLNEAARAAAAEATGQGGPDPEVQAEQENHVNAELAAVMAELGGGASGADLLDGLCDGAAAFLLWAEGKALELGINWTLARRKSQQRLRTKPIEQSALMRKALRVGLKGMAVVHFPEFATRLTPGWAIAIGLVGGAGQTLMLGELVDKSTGETMKVADAVSQAQEAVQQGAPATPPPPA